MRWKQWRVGITIPAAALLAATMAALPTSAVASQASTASNPIKWGLCSAPGHAQNCADATYTNVGYKGWYVGHDEPSLEFKSNLRGSGNDMTYLMTLPKDPTVQRTADGGPGSSSARRSGSG